MRIRGLFLGISIGACLTILAYQFHFQKLGEMVITQGTNSILSQQKEKFDTVYNLLQKEYFDSGAINPEAMVENALKGFVEALEDPYTSYMDKQESSGLNEELKGEQDFEGIGAIVTKKADGVMIEEVIKGSPAATAGLKPLDLIIQINGSGTKLMNLIQAVQAIRGPENTQVELTIIRTTKSEKTVLRKKVTRKKLSYPSVNHKIFTGDKTIGYIAISVIGEQTENLLKQSIKELSQYSPEGIILDLRGNGGGFLPIANSITSHFIPKGLQVVSSRYTAYEGETYTSQGYGPYENTPVVVLVDELTASAGEIIALALKEQKGSLIIGSKTFGKGSIQTLQDFGDGTSLKYTIGKRFSPKGENIDLIGITPDIIITANTGSEDENVIIDKQLERAQEEIKKLIK